MSWKKFVLWMREHWMLAIAIGLVLAAVIAVSIACGVAAPAVIAFFSGLSVSGFAPFAAIATWGVAEASLACVGIAAAAAAIPAIFYNVVYAITRALDMAIRPKADEYVALFEDLAGEEDLEVSLHDLPGSAKSIAGGLGAPRKGCCEGDDELDESEEDELEGSKQKKKAKKEGEAELTDSKKEAELTDSKKEAELTGSKKEAELTGSKKEVELTDSKKGAKVELEGSKKGAGSLHGSLFAGSGKKVEDKKEEKKEEVVVELLKSGAGL